MTLKVLHVFKTYRPDTFGGIERVIHNLCVATKPLGIESSVFTLSPAPPAAPVFHDGYWVHAVKRDFTLHSTDISIAAISKFKALARQADIIHYQFPWPWMDVMHFSAHHGKPSIVTYQSDIIRQKLLGALYQPLMYTFLNSMDAIVATSPAYASTSSVLKLYKDRVSVIPIGLEEENYGQADPALVAHFANRFPRPFFLSVGVMRYYKGLDFLIDAAAYTNADIVIAGAGPEDAHLRAKAAAMNNVHFLGAVDETDKIALLSQARALVFPSHLRSEAFGLSLVEAAMAGRPMISCDIGTGTSFVNIHEQTGIVVPPENGDALAAAMNRLVAEPDTAQHMGEAARQRFLSHFTATQMANKYVGLYSSLANRSQAKAKSAS